MNNFKLGLYIGLFCGLVGASATHLFIDRFYHIDPKAIEKGIIEKVDARIDQRMKEFIFILRK